MENSNEKLMTGINDLEECANAALALGAKNDNDGMHAILKERIKNAAKKLKETVNAKLHQDRADSPCLQLVVWDRDSNAKTEIFCLADSHDRSAVEEFFNALRGAVRPSKILLNVLDSSKKRHKIFCHSIVDKRQVENVESVVEKFLSHYCSGGASMGEMIEWTAVRAIRLEAAVRAEQNDEPPHKPFN